MPTEPGTMPDSVERRSYRLALGVATTFALAQAIAWPLAFVAPVFAVVLLLDVQPLGVRAALITLGWTLAGLATGLAIGLTLKPYPAISVIIFCFVVYWFYYFAMVSKVHLLAIVGALIGTLIMPILSQTFPELPLTALYSVGFGLVVAVLCSWTMFLILPPPAVTPEAPAEAKETSREEVHAAALRTTCVVAPLLVTFLVFGWAKILVLIYAALFAIGFSAEGSLKAGAKSIVANLFLGAPAAIIVYELIVIAPGLGFATLLVFAASLLFAVRIFSGGKNAALWKSGMMGFMLLLGGSLGAFAPDADDKSLDRVLQIAAACAYVIAAYTFLDIVRDMWQGPRMTKVRQLLGGASS